MPRKSFADPGFSRSMAAAFRKNRKLSSLGKSTLFKATVNRVSVLL